MLTGVHMNAAILWLVALLAAGGLADASAQALVLQADARARPPEMVVDDRTGVPSGPLVEILEEAARSVGYSVKWRSVPFTRSLEQLRTGETDIVPRLMLTEDRKTFVDFLGPIGVKAVFIEFLVKPGSEHRLKSYDDLKTLLVGVKRGTSYFERFDRDGTIRRMESVDDENMARMFAFGRFDTMIVLDRPALEQVLKEQRIGHYAWADYKVPLSLPVYFGMAKASRHAGGARQLSDALKKMASTGRVADIYRKFELVPPAEK